MNKHHILCLDEGHGPVSPFPHEGDGTTALMVNPTASQSVLLDAANTRVARIIDVTKLFIDLENAEIDFPREDAARLLTTVCAMAQEVGHLLTAAQDHPMGLESMRKSFRETVEAAEALLSAITTGGVLADAAFEMEGHIGASRDDFLGPKGAKP